MAHTKSSSVANLRSLFEPKPEKVENKPIQRPKARSHSSADFWKDVFKTKQHELTQGPSKVLHENWDHEEKEFKSKQINPGKIGNGDWNPQNEWESKQREVGKLSITDQVC